MDIGSDNGVDDSTHKIHNNVFLPTPYGVRENCIGQTDGHISKMMAFGRAIVKVLVYMYMYIRT